MIEDPVQDKPEVEEVEPQAEEDKLEVQEGDKHELEARFHSSKRLRSDVMVGRKSYSCCKVKYHTCCHNSS